MVFRVKWKKLKGKKNSPLREERKTWWMNRLTHPLRFILPAASLSSFFRCLKEPSPTCEKKWPLFLLGASAQLIPYKHLLFITLEGQGGRSPSTLFFIILDCEVKKKKIASPYFFFLILDCENKRRCELSWAWGFEKQKATHLPNMLEDKSDNHLFNDLILHVKKQKPTGGKWFFNVTQCMSIENENPGLGNSCFFQ